MKLNNTLMLMAIVFFVIAIVAKCSSQEGETSVSNGRKRDVSGTKIYQSLKNLDDSKARSRYNKSRRNVGYRPVITWLPQGASLNVGPVIVSEDRRYVRMTINPFFSSIVGFKTFSYRK